MKKQLFLSYILIASLGAAAVCAEPEIQEKTDKQKHSLARDIAYTGLGIACWAGVYLVLKLHVNLKHTRKLLDSPATIAGDANSHAIMTRWSALKGLLAKVIGCYLGVGLLAVGTHFVGKGVYFNNKELDDSKRIDAYALLGAGLLTGAVVLDILLT